MVATLLGLLRDTSAINLQKIQTVYVSLFTDFIMGSFGIGHVNKTDTMCWLLYQYYFSIIS